MDLKATLWKINEKGNGPELTDKGYPFRIQDVTGLLRDLELGNTLIVEIDPYKCGNNSEKIKEQVNTLMESDAGDDILVIASAYISEDEFPKSEYYSNLPGLDDRNEDEKNGKQELPFHETMERQCKVLEDAGFVSINEFCKLEFSDVYVSPLNLNGIKVRDKVNEMCGK